MASNRDAAFVTRSVRRAWEETGRAGASTLEARGLVAEEWLLRLCDALDSAGGGESGAEIVRWVDSASINGGLWVDPELINPDALTEQGLTSESVGFVHAESPDAILLVQSRNPDRVGAALSIPKKAILDRRRLT